MVSNTAEFGLSTAEGKVLLALVPGDTLSMRALARKLGYDASNLTGSSTSSRIEARSSGASIDPTVVSRQSPQLSRADSYVSASRTGYAQTPAQ